MEESVKKGKSETIGILKLDISKPRRSSGSSVDFKIVDNKSSIQVEPASPQPSVDRLSVTFADRSDCSENSVKVNVFDPGSPPVQSVRDMVTFSGATDEPEDDYSASINQILSRRESTRRSSQRRRKRRPSSPFSTETDPSKRRASIYTNSSAETTVSMEQDATASQEQIFENIRLHKEVLSNVKYQPWPMRRKIKLVQQAKIYIKKHEGELQERLAQSKSTKDFMARFHIWLIKRLQYLRRESANMMNQMIPWELRIKEIESHFGSAVASYFTFLRWMFWVNLVISVVIACFVVIPEVLTADIKKSGDRKIIPDSEKSIAYNLATLWDFEGILKYSPIFYGFYTNEEKKGSQYQLPFAYFMTGIAVYVYSFVATLRKMAKNSRLSKLSEKGDECTFTWKLFSGWDYMIGNSETAHNRVASIVLGFKEALLEETERTKEEQKWRVIGLRVLVNFVVLSLLIFSAYLVFIVVERSTQPEADDTWWRQNEITVSLSVITLIFPIFFEILGMFEGYHPRKCLRIQLARIMILNLLNLYTLIFSLFWKISTMVVELQDIKNNITASRLSNMKEPCRNITIDCAKVATTVLLATTMVSNPSTSSSFSENPTESISLYNPRLLATSISTTSTDATGVRNFEYDDDEWTTTEQSNVDDEDPYPNILPTLAIFQIFKQFFWPAKVTVDGEELSNTTSIFTSETFQTPEPQICYTLDCPERNEEFPENDPQIARRLPKLCWETMFGQELVKLTVMDLVLTIISILLVDFFRALFVRFMNTCWCWDLEKQFPQYGDFKIAENILHLVNNQGMVWMGMFFSPGLPAINLIKLGIMMYLRSWAVLTCNVPHEVVFRASRSNNFYLALLLTMLFLCVLPVGYAIVWLDPSWHCGPFSNYTRISNIFTENLNKIVPKSFERVLDYIASPAIIIPLLMLLVLIIYYLISLTNSLREANNDLKTQLRRERTEERRKMYQLVDRNIRKGSGGSDSAFAKWKKILPDFDDSKKTVKKELLAKLLAKKNNSEDVEAGLEKEQEKLEVADILPVITISKTESAENILEKKDVKRITFKELVQRQIEIYRSQKEKARTQFKMLMKREEK